MFALQLVKAIASVRSHKLVGGEVSCDNIEEVIKTRPAKVLYNRFVVAPFREQ